jgi:hypothetical protein
MKNEAPQHSQLNEQSIKDAAAAALHHLQLDVEAKAVSADGDAWCIQFTADYNQFCDSFRDQFGKENSFELIREKVKRHILKQQQNKIRAGVRIRRGKTKRPAPQPATLFETTLKTIEDIAGQTAEFAGEVIHQASSLPEAALRTLDEATKAANSTTTLITQAVERVAEQPSARVTVKAAAKAQSKRSSSARKAVVKKATAKKAASKKTRAAAKSTSRPGKKSGGTKKKNAGRK